VEMGEGAMNDLFSLDTKSHTWQAIQPATDAVPPKRSYHAACGSVHGGRQYVWIFGGCGEQGKGRLNDLWCFDVEARTWSAAPVHEPIQGRGGASLVASNDGSKIFVVGGFCGHELGDMYEYDVAARTWREVPPSGLPARSVFGAATHACAATGAQCGHAGHVVVFGGEVDPSNLGHEGAGDFAGDVWCWGEGQGWHKVTTESEGAPCARGWYASTHITTGKTHEHACNHAHAHAHACVGLVVHGGLDCKNERLDDMYLLCMHG